MSSQDVMPSKKACNNPGLCTVKGQNSGLCNWDRERNHFLSLSLSTDKTLPYY